MDDAAIPAIHRIPTHAGAAPSRHPDSQALDLLAW